MEWFLPLWVSKRDVAKILATARHSSRQQALQWFHYHTSTLYTLSFQAMCIAQFLPQARSLSELVPLARESYLAFYSGYRASSIAALIPAIEGSLSRIVSSSEQDLPIPIKIDRVIDRAIATAARLHFEQMWVPQEYQSKDYLLVRMNVSLRLRRSVAFCSIHFSGRAGNMTVQRGSIAICSPTAHIPRGSNRPISSAWSSSWRPWH